MQQNTESYGKNLIYDFCVKRAVMFLLMYKFRYLLKNNDLNMFNFHSKMLKIKTSLCTSYSTCPTVHVKKHLSCLTYGRVPTKRRNYVETRNFRIIQM